MNQVPVALLATPNPITRGRVDKRLCRCSGECIHALTVRRATCVAVMPEDRGYLARFSLT
jgi:hypothetical protein